MGMDRNPCFARRYDAPETVAALPAEARTVGTSRSGDLVIVAHSGNAHLAVVVDRAFVRGLEDALARTGPYAPPAVPLDDERLDHDVELPEEIRFRHAKVRDFTVCGADVYAVLEAAGDPREPDVYVDLRLDPDLLRRIEVHRNRVRVHRALVAAAVVVLVAVWVLLLAMQ